jgi:DsbC/DsbD-like thiol-disulfide interchange protein
MLLRSLLAVLAGLACAGPAQADDHPYRVSLVGDAYDGRLWHTGVRIALDDGWKTYWRMPGESGVPPDFTWTASRPADIEVQYPVPSRYSDASGETVGYEHEVIFPVTVAAGDATEVELKLDLFFAVCKDVCIPARAEASKDLGPAVRDPLGAARVEEAQKRLPRPGAIVRAADVVTEGGGPALRLALDARVDDVFVEGTGAAYFRRPHFSPDGRTAVLVIDNLDGASALKGARLTITAVGNGAGLEQTITLP